MMKLLSRRDEGLGAGLFDSIKWAFEQHVHEPDSGLYNYGILYGSEDCPDRIDFWIDEPENNMPPRWVWLPRRELLMNS